MLCVSAVIVALSPIIRAPGCHDFRNRETPSGWVKRRVRCGGPYNLLLLTVMNLPKPCTAKHIQEPDKY